MSAPADPVRNPRRSLRAGDLGTAFKCLVWFGAAAPSRTAAAAYLIGTPPFSSAEKLDREMVLGF
jgi:hypothetical protein